MGKGVGHRSGYLVGRIWGSMPPVYCTLPIAFLPRRVGSPTSRTLERVQHRRARAREAAPSARVVPTFAPGPPLVGQSPPKRWGSWKRPSVQRILCGNALQSSEACHLHYSLRISLLTAAFRLQCQQASSRPQCQQAASRLQRAGSKGVRLSVVSTVLRFFRGRRAVHI